MADSGDSSPHSAAATDDAHHEGPEASAAAPPPPKVRLMVSYGGRIQPRPHDNQLAYVSGDTKILSLERPLRFADLAARLAALVGAAAGEFCVKYQLPGEDLDALVSVTNDEDLEHLVLEYDRLHLLRPAATGGSSRGSTLRLRVFLFPVQSPPPPPSGLIEPKPERHWFIEALNTVPQRKQEAPPAQQSSPPQQKQEAVFVQQQQQAPAAPQQPFVLTPMGPDYLFGHDNGFVPPPAVKVKDPAGDPPMGRENVPVEVPAKNEDRSPPNRQIQEIENLQVADNNASHQPQPPALPRNGSDDSLTRAYPPANAEYYIAAKFPEKPPVPPQPATYLPVPGRYTSVAPGSGAEHAPVFFIPAPHGGYYATAAPPGANSYPTMYAVAALPNAANGNGNGNDSAPSHNAATAYAPPPAHQVAYDSNGRAIYYTSVLPQYPSAVSGMSAAPGAVLGTEPAKPPAAVKPTVS
jgi:hypothetical protein